MLLDPRHSSETLTLDDEARSQDHDHDHDHDEHNNMGTGFLVTSILSPPARSAAAGLAPEAIACLSHLMFAGFYPLLGLAGLTADCGFVSRINSYTQMWRFTSHPSLAPFATKYTSLEPRGPRTATICPL
jgi:hypothetical protein